MGKKITTAFDKFSKFVHAVAQVPKTELAQGVVKQPPVRPR